MSNTLVSMSPEELVQAVQDFKDRVGSYLNLSDDVIVTQTLSGDHLLNTSPLALTFFNLPS